MFEGVDIFIMSRNFSLPGSLDLVIFMSRGQNSWSKFVWSKFVVKIRGQNSSNFDHEDYGVCISNYRYDSIYIYTVINNILIYTTGIILYIVLYN